MLVQWTEISIDRLDVSNQPWSIIDMEKPKEFMILLAARSMTL